MYLTSTHKIPDMLTPISGSIVLNELSHRSYSLTFGTAIKVEVNGVLYDVPATARMSSSVEVKKEDVEEKKEEEKPKIVWYKRVKEEWQLVLKCFELVRKLLMCKILSVT